MTEQNSDRELRFFFWESACSFAIAEGGVHPWKQRGGDRSRHLAASLAVLVEVEALRLWAAPCKEDCKDEAEELDKGKHYSHTPQPHQLSQNLRACVEKVRRGTEAVHKNMGQQCRNHRWTEQDFVVDHMVATCMYSWLQQKFVLEEGQSMRAQRNFQLLVHRRGRCYIHTQLLGRDRQSSRTHQNTLALLPWVTQEPAQT
mmetsp:Transcript_10043/g.19126  ORF Transcript_10043/g.19126 Transcript_10043/m.19126 type:complete len:201 (-) Transcript_10043:35-637(-)